MKLIHYINGILFPPKCILCARLLEKGELDLCHACRATAPEYPQGKLKLQFIDSVTAVWYYKDSVRSSLLRYKFGRARFLAEPYGRLLAMKLLTGPEKIDLITWVPISPLRRLIRGYDQDELLAMAVARELGVPCVRLLKKVRHNPPQSGIDGYAKRRANVLGAYRAENVQQISGKRIVLVDDIVTTGATAGECARMLLTLGAEEVHCAVVAAAHHK